MSNAIPNAIPFQNTVDQNSTSAGQKEPDMAGTTTNQNENPKTLQETPTNDIPDIRVGDFNKEAKESEDDKNE